MANTEVDYAETEYQQTNYNGSDAEVEDDDEAAMEQDGELPVVNGADSETGPSTSVGVDKAAQKSSLPSDVLRILKERWPAWKSAKKGERRNCWKGIVAELRMLAIHQSMDNVEWVPRLKVSSFSLLIDRKANHGRPTLHGCIVKAELG